MVSLRFPFSFSQPSKGPRKTHASSSFSKAMAGSILAAVTVGIGTGFAISQKSKIQTDPFTQKPWDFFFSSRPEWASLSLADNGVVESKAGISFPTILKDTQHLLGIGMRKKSIMGLKNIDVYAFGVYADDSDIKSLLSEKYGTLSVSELKGNKNFNDDILDRDLCMTVRLQIVYGRLSIRSVRSAFEESVGSRLQKFSGSDNKELLQRFTSQFRDEYRLPPRTIIDLSRERGHILRTTIDGKEVGSIESKLLCRSIFDLYIGEDPFDRHAKENIEIALASLLQK
ncbi:chalcone-flavanone isomerase family protein [Tasmannia lanceolata]|uniref:chalcone-flavanone isomerase family protein n=1 Tax=Tasmannia lanceolata TaxID=3420 RepID=UPI004063376D